MLLPEIKIPVSIDIFETQLEYFMAGYSDPQSNSFSLKKCDIGNSGHRYSVFVEKNDSEKPTQLLVGEIDVIMINVNKVVVNSAAYSIEETRAGTQFFDYLFHKIYDFWNISPKSLENFDDSFNVATVTLIRIASETGYLGLPNVVSKMPESKNINWTEGININPPVKIENSTLSISNGKQEEIIKMYNLEINRGLSEHYRLNEKSDNTESIHKVENFRGNKEEITHKSPKLWQQIPDKGNDREILRLWHQGYTAPQIAAQFHYSERTIYNKIHQLRKKHGTKIVPKRINM